MGTPYQYRQKFAVLILDILAFLAAFAVAMHLRFNARLGMFEPGYPPWGEMLNALPIMLGVWLATVRGCSLYRVERLGALEEVARLFQALMLFLGVLLSVTFFYRGFSYSRGFALLFVPLLVGLTMFLRLSRRVVRQHLMSMEGVRTRLLLVGHSPVAVHLAKASLESDSPIVVAGILDDELPIGTVVAAGIQVIGTTESLKACAERSRADGIVITTSKLTESAQLGLLDACLASDLEWHVVPNVYEIMLDRMRFDVVAGVPILGLRRPNLRGLNRILKRGLDVLGSTVLIALLSPLMLAVAIAIKLSSKGPVFFTQERVGERGQIFRFLKFRSMHVGNDDAIHRAYARRWIEEGQAAGTAADGERVFKIQKDPRLIPIGPFIRKYSIDELPQLFNVLKGDMSLIGPRPPIPYEVEVYREWHRRRLDGPQGITGLWQVSGRNRLSFDEMVKLDIEYIENWSLGLDLKILWRTVGTVLFGKAY